VYEQRTLYGALVVTLAILLRLINCRFIIIIIIIIIVIIILLLNKQLIKRTENRIFQSTSRFAYMYS